MAELAPLALLLGREIDLLCCPEAVPEAYRESLGENGIEPARTVDGAASVEAADGFPWGRSPGALDLLRRHGHRIPGPSAEVARAVNDRLFGHRIEVDLELLQPGCGPVRDDAEIEVRFRELERVAGAAGRWVLKARFGSAGRGRLLGRGRSLPAAGRAWTRRRWADGETLLFEPWVEKTEEVSVAGEIDSEGGVRLVGATGLETDRSGIYRGSWIGRPVDETLDPGVRQTAEIVGERLGEAGYRGPFGIDAYRYRDDSGEIRTRRLVEINARWTMGRVALALRSLLPAGSVALWTHRFRLPEAPGIWPTSPETVGGRPCRQGSTLVWGADREEVRARLDAASPRGYPPA